MPMQFNRLVTASNDVAHVSGRLDKIARLADLLRAADADDIEIAVAFLSGESRQGRIGLGYSAVAATADVPPADASHLTLAEVDAAFAAIAGIAGKGAGHDRARALRALLARATADDQDFIRRLLFGELRQGALEGVLVEAVARAASVSPAVVRRAAMLTGDLGATARAALSGGDSALAGFSIQLLRPVQPMLAESAADLDAAMTTLDEASLEYKLDGARVQVHKAGDEVRLFSRSLRDVTAAAPDIVDIVRRFPVRDAILDGEVIVLTASGRPQPFQITMRRFGRRLDVAGMMTEFPLTPFFFDLLYADGAPLLDEPLERRAAVLAEAAGNTVVPRLLRPARDAARAFAAAALAGGHEGVMAKSLAAPYAAGRRGAAWLKVKQARTLDLVVLAAEWGHGRRRGWLSNLHLGARDPATGGFVMLGKTFKGMTDDMLTWQTAHLQTLETGRDGYTVYLKPELVVEVAFNEIQQSPVYPGGLALRFARVKRYRLDKTAAEADTIETVRAIG